VVPGVLVKLGGGAVTVTVAVSDAAEFATLVASTWKIPATAGAVYRPVVSIDPPVASNTDQVTARFEVPVTVAANGCVRPTPRVDVRGVIATVIVGAAVTVTVAVSDAAGVATVVTTTWKVPAVAGAVYLPVVSIAPPVASVTDQVTAVFEVPVTVAAKVFVAFTLRLNVFGVTATVIVGVMGVAALLDPPQAVRVSANSPMMRGNTKLKTWERGWINLLITKPPNSLVKRIARECSIGTWNKKPHPKR
jgi:hypothetical protein